MGWFPVDPLGVTAEWLSDVLDAEVRECRVEQICIGVGLLGRIYRAHLGGVGVPESVVIKLPTLDPQARTDVCENLEFYRREVRFYQEIGCENPLPPARPYFAGFDESTQDFILVLEDLGRLRSVDQTAGCSQADAETVVDAIAGHHAHWWENPRLAALPWLKTYTEPPFPDVLAANFRAAWPLFLDRIGSGLPSAIREWGERFPSLVPWYIAEICRPPHTFLHGDLRLDQLFFATEDRHPPVTALDWQISFVGRGAYDLAYFMSQSLDTETRRASEQTLIERYGERLAERGIAYPADELRRDYQITTAWCLMYPVIGAGRKELDNDRQLRLLRTMLDGAVAAIEDNDALALRPG